MPDENRCGFGRIWGKIPLRFRLGTKKKIHRWSGKFTDSSLVYHIHVSMDGVVWSELVWSGLAKKEVHVTQLKTMVLWSRKFSFSDLPWY